MVSETGDGIGPSLGIESRFQLHKSASTRDLGSRLLARHFSTVCAGGSV